MSQRGGSVVTYVRYGDKVASPIIDKGEADFIVSFELLEAARWLGFLKPDGQIVTSTQQIDPMPVITGAAAYPQDQMCIRDRSKGVASVSLETGVPVMFGVLTTENIEQAIERAGTKAGNKGYDCALGAVEMVNLIREIDA